KHRGARPDSRPDGNRRAGAAGEPVATRAHAGRCGGQPGGGPDAAHEFRGQVLIVSARAAPRVGRTRSDLARVEGPAGAVPAPAGPPPAYKTLTDSATSSGFPALKTSLTSSSLPRRVIISSSLRRPCRYSSM